MACSERELPIRVTYQSRRLLEPLRTTISAGVIHRLTVTWRLLDESDWRVVARAARFAAHSYLVVRGSLRDNDGGVEERGNKVNSAVGG